MTVPVVLLWTWVAGSAACLAAFALTGLRLVRARRQVRWLSTHDRVTGMLQRDEFVRQVTRGTVRDRAGTVFVVEVQDLADLADVQGFEAADAVMTALVARVRSVTGETLAGRWRDDRIVVFVRGADVGRSRQTARALQLVLPQPVRFGARELHPVVCTGVAQADGVVIDVLTAIRRAAVALVRARRAGGSQVVLDTDLTAAG